MYYGYPPHQQAAYAPQGFFGDVLSQIAAPVGGMIGDYAGNRQMGQNLGNAAGAALKFLPFQAGPMPYGGGLQGGQQYYAPQGFFGDVLSQIAAPVGGMIGDYAGNRQMGQNIGSVAGEMAKWLPFEAGPMAQPYAPQGIFGGALGSMLGGPLGGMVGDLFGNKALGEQLGGTLAGVGPVRIRMGVIDS